ncbi:MAG: hypothetical protein ACR2K1_03410 [Saprospiraceae bacterium]
MIDLTAELIQVRDLTDYIKTREAFQDDCAAEFYTVTALLIGLENKGSDFNWRGAWFPEVLIADKAFADYALELAADACDAAHLPEYIEIDREGTAANLIKEYSSVKIDRKTYWYR